MQFAIITVLASVALLSTLSAAAPTESLDRGRASTRTVRVQLDGNNPSGEDAIQIDIVLDGSPQQTGGNVLVGASIVQGEAICKLFSDLNGRIPISPPFSTGEDLVIDPPTLARSIRCEAGNAKPAPPPKGPAESVTVQLDGNNPAGEDAIQRSITLDGSAQLIGNRVLIGASIVEGSGNCKLFSDAKGKVPINKQFSTGKAVKINPPTFAHSIRCTA